MEKIPYKLIRAYTQNNLKTIWPNQTNLQLTVSLSETIKVLIQVILNSADRPKMRVDEKVMSSSKDKD